MFHLFPFILDKIAVGSFQGVIRIFNPTKPQYKGTFVVHCITIFSDNIYIYLPSFIYTNILIY